MKSSYNSKFRPLYFFIKHKKISSFLSILLTLSFLNLIISCSYYNVKDLTTTPENIASQIDELNKTDNYVVIHSGGTIWNLKSLVLNEENKTISGIAQEIDARHIPLKKREKKNTHRYTSKQSPLNEVHFFVNNQTVPEFGSKTIIPFSEIYNISLNDKNTGKTIINVVLGTIGVVAVIFIIVQLTKSSCPFVYVNNGEEFVFTGELYPGVITANQQRDDYLPLPKLNLTDNTYTIKITNELKEIQYTDFVQLLEVFHPDSVKVLLDQYGNLQTFSNITLPESVLVDQFNVDNSPSKAKDNDAYLFNTVIPNSSSIRQIEAKFQKPNDSKQAKLFLTVKNSMWLDYVFGKFNAQFGTYYPKFQKDQQNYSAEKSKKWMQEQHIPLSVYIKTVNGWELIDKINTVGPMAYRDIAIPLDLNKIAGDKVIIKLETGFMFWEVDYVGIDYSDNLKLDVNYISPSSAIDGNNIDVTQLLSKQDNSFFVQPNVGDEVIVSFKTNVTNSETNKTLFLKNRGYYNYIRDYDTEPNFQKLKLFKEPGAFTNFSKYEYEALMDYEKLNTIASTSN